MQPQFAAKFRASKGAVAELREESHLDGSEEDLGVPKGKSRLQDSRRVEWRIHAAEHDQINRKTQSRPKPSPHGGVTAARRYFSKSSRMPSMVFQLRVVAGTPRCFSTTALE